MSRFNQTLFWIFTVFHLYLISNSGLTCYYFFIYLQNRISHSILAFLCSPIILLQCILILSMNWYKYNTLFICSLCTEMSVYTYYIIRIYCLFILLCTYINIFVCVYTMSSDLIINVKIESVSDLARRCFYFDILIYTLPCLV